MAAIETTPVSTPFIKDARSLRVALTRMRATHQAVVFWNTAREFLVMVRPADYPDDPGDPDDPPAYEVCISPCSDDSDDDDDEGGCSGAMRRALELECEGEWDDDDVFVVDSFEAGDDEALEAARALINRVHATVLCKCGSYLIKDGAPMCLLCQMTDDAPGAKGHFCAICHDTGPARHMRRQPCCGQMLHGTCVRTWRAKSGDMSCPLCRACPARP